MKKSLFAFTLALAFVTAGACSLIGRKNHPTSVPQKPAEPAVPTPSRNPRTPFL